MLATTGSASAQDAGVGAETAYIFNSLSFLMHGFLVMWMAAGFCMLEAGLVRKRSVATQLLKNVSLFALAGIMFYLVGYQLMYSGVDGGYIGSFAIWGADDSAALAETGADFGAGYAASSDWFFQMVFVAATASIVSGAMAERVQRLAVPGIHRPAHRPPLPDHRRLAMGRRLAFRRWVFPTLPARRWCIRSAAGPPLPASSCSARARANTRRSGQVNPMLGSSLPLATIGTFILWLGWFGFNGGSQLAMGSAADVVAIANIYVNTNMAACGGVLTAMILSELLYKKIDLTMVLNGALAGLVSITAEPLGPDARPFDPDRRRWRCVWWCSRCRSWTSSSSTTWSVPFRCIWSPASGAP